MRIIKLAISRAIGRLQAILMSGTDVLDVSTDRNDHGFPLVDEPVDYSEASGQYERQGAEGAHFLPLEALIDPVHRYRVVDAIGGGYRILDRVTQRSGAQVYTAQEAADLVSWLIERGLNYLPGLRPEHA